MPSSFTIKKASNFCQTIDTISANSKLLLRWFFLQKTKLPLQYYRPHIPAKALASIISWLDELNEREMTSQPGLSNSNLFFTLVRFSHRFLILHYLEKLQVKRED